MSRHIHQKERGSRKCIVCDSPTCPAVGGNLLDCDERIPRLLEHGVRWFIIDRMVDFSSFSIQFGYGGSFQINSADVSEGLAAIASGRRAMGRGGHGPGVDLEGGGEVKSAFEIGGDPKEARRYNHQFGKDPITKSRKLREENDDMFYVQALSLCREHRIPKCPICLCPDYHAECEEHGKEKCKEASCKTTINFDNVGFIRLIIYRFSTDDTAWVELLERWLYFYAVEGRSLNNFQPNAESSDREYITTHSLGDLELPVYIDATFNIDEDYLEVHHNRTHNTNPEQATLIEKNLLSAKQLKDLCKSRNIRGFSSKAKNELIEMLEENGVDRNEFIGLHGFYRTILETQKVNWSGKINGQGKTISLGQIALYLAFGYTGIPIGDF